MPARKIAISLPESVLTAVDALAADLGESRSGLIARILSEVADRRRDRDVSEAVDALFADDGLLEEQRRTSESFRGAGPWRDAAW